jgi:2-dehydro-3-deoxyphosphogalactonate aldolase
MTTPTNQFLKTLSTSKIIVILRNIKIDQVEEHVGLLEHYGLNTIEITLNSPDPFKSIELVSKKFPKINVGAGTVILKDDITKLSDIGVRFIVSPNTDPQIIEETLNRNLVSVPGFYSATEGFRAIKYGATILKLFPAGSNGLNLIKDYSAVFPLNIKLVPTGGINLDNMNNFLDKSFAIGIGGALFSENISLKDFEDRIKKIKLFLNI